MNLVTNTLHGLIELLDQLAIPYAMMGGFAVRAHGVPRPTYDIDLTIALERTQLPEFLDRLRDEDYTIPEAYDAGWIDNLKDLSLLKLKRYMQGESLDVDLFLAESEFQKELMRRRRRVDADGRVVWVVSPEDLVLLKTLAGRPRDLGDINDIIFMQGRLDEAYLREWAAELGILKELEAILADVKQDEL